MEEKIKDLEGKMKTETVKEEEEEEKVMDEFQPLSGYLLLDFLFPTLLHYLLTLQGISLFDVDKQHGPSFYVIPIEYM